MGLSPGLNRMGSQLSPGIRHPLRPLHFQCDQLSQAFSSSWLLEGLRTVGRNKRFLHSLGCSCQGILSQQQKIPETLVLGRSELHTSAPSLQPASVPNPSQLTILHALLFH